MPGSFQFKEKCTYVYIYLGILQYNKRSYKAVVIKRPLGGIDLLPDKSKKLKRHLRIKGKLTFDKHTFKIRNGE